MRPGMWRRWAVAGGLLLGLTAGSGCIEFPQYDLSYLNMAHGSAASLDYAARRRRSAMIGRRLSSAGMITGFVQMGAGLATAAPRAAPEHSRR